MVDLVKRLLLLLRVIEKGDNLYMSLTPHNAQNEKKIALTNIGIYLFIIGSIGIQDLLNKTTEHNYSLAMVIWSLFLFTNLLKLFNDLKLLDNFNLEPRI